MRNKSKCEGPKADRSDFDTDESEIKSFGSSRTDTILSRVSEGWFLNNKVATINRTFSIQC